MEDVKNNNEQRKKKTLAGERSPSKILPFYSKEIQTDYQESLFKNKWFILKVTKTRHSN